MVHSNMHGGTKKTYPKPLPLTQGRATAMSSDMVFENSGGTATKSGTATRRLDSGKIFWSEGRFNLSSVAMERRLAALMPICAACTSKVMNDTSNVGDLNSGLQFERWDPKVRVLEEIPHVVAVQERVLLLVRQNRVRRPLLCLGRVADEARYASSRDTTQHRPRM